MKTNEKTDCNFVYCAPNILKFAGEEFLILGDIFPYPVANVPWTPKHFKESASTDVKISEIRVKTVSTKKRKCKLVFKCFFEENHF